MSDIEINQFSKKFGSFTAVKDVSLVVNKGELFGLIGPDGAGKTTLMRVICTLLLPTSGSVIVRGLDVTKNVGRIRAMLGYMPQRFSLYQDLSVQQNLMFFADLFEVTLQERTDRLKQLYRFSRLEPFKTRRAGALSGGMKQKLALSCALIHTPEILILDEPTFGVDPVSRQEFWEILRTIQGQGTTILVSTAYMDEANQCDRIALQFDGEIRATGTPQDLKSGYRYPLYRIYATEIYQLYDFFRSRQEVKNAQIFGDAVHVSFIDNPGPDAWQNYRTLSRNNMIRWERQTPSIEDVFLDLMRGGHEN
jgi:ABC-2 type transport system ATP-binding protein